MFLLLHPLNLPLIYFFRWRLIGLSNFFRFPKKLCPEKNPLSFWRRKSWVNIVSESNRSCGNLAFFTEPDLASFFASSPAFYMTDKSPSQWQKRGVKSVATWAKLFLFQRDLPQYLPISSMMTHTQCILLSAQSNIRMNLWSSRIDTNTSPRGMPNTCSQSGNSSKKNCFMAHFSSHAHG